MTRELSPLFHMGDEVIPDLAVAELVRWCASWQGAAKAVAAGESKMVRALRDSRVVFFWRCYGHEGRGLEGPRKCRGHVREEDGT